MKRSRIIRYGLLAAGLSMTHALSQSPEDELISNLYSDIHIANCGVSSGYIAASLTGVNVQAVLSSLNTKAGLDWVKPLSFNDLQQTFFNCGVNTVAIKNVDYRDIPELLQSCDAIIVHIWTGKSVGHFVVVKKVDKGIRLYNPPNLPLSLSISDIVAMLQKVGSGNLLLIEPNSRIKLKTISSSDPDAADAAKNKLTNERSSGVTNVVYSGNHNYNSTEQEQEGEAIIVPRSALVEVDQNDKNILIAKFQLYNRGSTPIKILDVKGSCGCFKGATGSGLLLPGETKELVARFDAAEFSATEGTNLGVITTDPKLPVATIKVAFANETFSFRVTPAFLDFSTIESAQIDDKVLRAYVLFEQSILPLIHNGDIELSISAQCDSLKFHQEKAEYIPLISNTFLVIPISISITDSKQSRYTEVPITIQVKGQPEFTRIIRVALRSKN